MYIYSALYICEYLCACCVFFYFESFSIFFSIFVVVKIMDSQKVYGTYDYVALFGEIKFENMMKFMNVNQGDYPLLSPCINVHKFNLPVYPVCTLNNVKNFFSLDKEER